MDKTKSFIIGNIVFLLTTAVSLGVYIATIAQHSKSIDENIKAVALVDSKAQKALELADGKIQSMDKQLNKRITEIADAGVARDTVNEKSVLIIDGKLNRIEDKLDAALGDLKDIKKIVLKPAISKTDSEKNYETSLAEYLKKNASR